VVLAGVALRHRAVRAARRLVAADRAAYDALWAGVVAAPGAKDALAALCHHSALLMANSDRGLAGPRQLIHRPLPAAAAAAAPWWKLPGGSGAGEKGAGMDLPVRCLDQLFAQAAVVAPLLMERVQQWALESGGGFPVLRGMRGGAWVRWAEARDDAAVRRMVRWGQCKSASRAVEKTVRSYDQVLTRTGARRTPCRRKIAVLAEGSTPAGVACGAVLRSGAPDAGESASLPCEQRRCRSRIAGLGNLTLLPSEGRVSWQPESSGSTGPRPCDSAKGACLAS
jgi:hypothetical protein